MTVQRKATIKPLDRSKPPKSGPPGKVAFPKYFEKVYRNGFKMFVVENHGLPLVTVGFVVKAGSTLDGGLPGLASVTSELLTKGTKNRNAVRIADEIDFVGGSLSSSSSWDSSQVFISTLKIHLDTCLEVLQDVVLNPSFPDEEIDRLRAQRIASIIKMKSEPSYLADTKFSSVVFKGHPYAMPAGGTEDSVTAMKREDFVGYHHDYYTPDSSFIVFAGDITAREADRFVSKYFGKWKGKNPKVSVPPPDGDSTDNPIYIVDKPGAVQSTLRIGHIGIARNNSDFIKVAFMNTLLGGYFGSRINMNLREAHGYTYGGRTIFDARILPGSFEVSADVRNEVTAETIDEIMKELKRIRTALPTKEEMKQVRGYLSGLFPIQLETPQQVAGRVVAIEMYHLPKNYYRNYRKNVAAVTAADVRSVARKYIHPDKLSIVLSGNSKEISRSLLRLRQVKVLSPSGKEFQVFEQGEEH